MGAKKIMFSSFSPTSMVKSKLVVFGTTTWLSTYTALVSSLHYLMSVFSIVMMSSSLSMWMTVSSLVVMTIPAIKSGC
jgi:hypothetical protein